MLQLLASPKREEGRYKSRTVDIKTKCGGKIIITIPDDIDRAVGSGARYIVNYSGLIMRTTVSFRDKNWEKIVSKHGEGMWLKVKEQFDVVVGYQNIGQAFVIDTMRRLFGAWKARLCSHYSSDSTDEERLSHQPENVELEGWKYLVKFFGSKEFKRNPLFGEKEPPDKVWELQHTRKDVDGELVWLDPRSQQIHGELQQLVVQQQSEEVDHPMTRDEILSSVLGERSGYVRGKGYRKKPPRKSQTQQANIEASVSYAVETMRQEMQVDMNRKLQEERKQMDRKLQEEREQVEQKLQEEREQMERKLEEDHALVKAEVDKMIKEQMAALITRIQQG